MLHTDLEPGVWGRRGQERGGQLSVGRGSWTRREQGAAGVGSAAACFLDQDHDKISDLWKVLDFVWE